MLSTWQTKAAVHVGVHEYHSRSKFGRRPGRDTEGLMTERIPKQEMKHPLSPWTNDVRISPVLSGLRMAHKMFSSRHPALKKYTRPKPRHRQRSLCWICVTYSFNSSQQMPLVACFVQALGHVQDKDDKDTEAPDHSYLGVVLNPALCSCLSCGRNACLGWIWPFCWLGPAVRSTLKATKSQEE